MKQWYAVFNMIAVIIIGMMIFSLDVQQQTYEKEYDTAVLKMATDYASIGALDASITYGNLGTDYVNMDSISMNPKNTLKVFNTIMCLSYGISNSELAMKTVDGSIASMILCSWDGYYVAEVADDGLKFTMKRPYSFNMNEETGSLKKNITIAMSLNTERTLFMRNDLADEISYLSSTYEELNDTLGSLGLGKFDIKMLEKYRDVAVSSLINDELIYSAEKIRSNRDREYRLYIPAYSTEDGINAINGPTLISINSGSGSYSGKADLSQVTMAGYKVISKIYTIGFTQDGVKYYCYEKQLPDTEKNNIFYFSSPYDAAKAGYIPHLEYLGREIGYTY